MTEKEEKPDDKDQNASPQEPREGEYGVSALLNPQEGDREPATYHFSKEELEHKEDPVDTSEKAESE